MDLDIDQSKFLYGFGGILGIASIIYFNVDIFSLSPTIKSFVFLSLSGILVVSGGYIQNKFLSMTAYVLSGFSYLGFLIYLYALLNLSEAQVFLMLAGSSIMFMGLGYIQSKDIYQLDNKKSKILILTILILVSSSLAFDFIGDKPEYRLDLKEEINITDDKVVFGTMQVENNFLFSRNIEIPRYDGCVAYNSTMTDGIYINEEPDIEEFLQGRESREYNLTDDIMLEPYAQNGRYGDTVRGKTVMNGTYTVKIGDCPSRPENRTIYINTDDVSNQVYGGKVEKAD